jgi:hypothetical protein
MNPKNDEVEKEYVFKFYEEEEYPLSACVKFIEAYKKDYVIGDAPFLLGPDDKPFEITDKQIFKIPECKDLCKLGFVDGGNSPILNSADFNISLVRVAGALFHASNWIQPSSTPEMIEFYTATILNPKGERSLEFITRFFPRERKYRDYLPDQDLPDKSIVINIKDPSIKSGRGFLPKIENFGSIARRFAEWSYARKFLSNELEEGDIFVRDGSLQTGYTGEAQLADKLYNTAMKKNVYVTGLSKTCRLFTNNGDSLISVIDLIANRSFPEEAWYYHPIYQITKADNKADLYFVKFHKHSIYPFRFDIYIEQSKKLDKGKREAIISNLASNSKDLSFPGYPYGLIKVDQMSRIAFNEIDTHKIMLISEFNKEDYEKFILPRLRSVDAHDLLNKIRK